MKRQKLFALFGAAICITSAVSAHEGATGIVKERMMAMKAVAEAMKPLGAMARGQTDYNARTVQDSAGTIAAHGGAALTDLYPEGSLDHPSEALPAIWAEWDRFTASANAMEQAARKLAAMAAATPDQAPAMPDTVRAAFGELGQTCGACHERFRVKK